MGAEVLAYRIGRQRGLELGHRAQHRRGEGVAVRAGPDAIIAEIVVAVVRDRRFDSWNERGRLGAAHIDQHARDIAEPAPVGCPTVVAHGLPPADYVVAAPSGGVLRLEHNPAVDCEYALPAAGAPGEHEEPGLAVC